MSVLHLSAESYAELRSTTCILYASSQHVLLPQAATPLHKGQNNTETNITPNRPNPPSSRTQDIRTNTSTCALPLLRPPLHPSRRMRNFTAEPFNFTTGPKRQAIKATQRNARCHSREIDARCLQRRSDCIISTLHRLWTRRARFSDQTRSESLLHYTAVCTPLEIITDCCSDALLIHLL